MALNREKKTISKSGKLAKMAKIKAVESAEFDKFITTATKEEASEMLAIYLATRKSLNFQTLNDPRTEDFVESIDLKMEALRGVIADGE